MANKVKLKTLVEKMNLKNLTPDVDLSEKEVRYQTLTDRLCSLPDSLNILIPNVCRS